MSDLALRYHGADALPSMPRSARPSLSLGAVLKRISAAVSAAQRRRMDGEVARMVAQNGGVFSDDLERRIAQRLGA